MVAGRRDIVRGCVCGAWGLRCRDVRVEAHCLALRGRKGDISDVVGVVSAHKGIQGDTDVRQWYEAQGLEGVPKPWGGEQDADDGVPRE